MLSTATSYRRIKSIKPQRSNMGFFERMMGNLMGGRFGEHHGAYQDGRHGGSKHGGYGGYSGYSQGSGPGGGNPGNSCPKCGSANANDARFCQQCGRFPAGLAGCSKTPLHLHPAPSSHQFLGILASFRVEHGPGPGLRDACRCAGHPVAIFVARIFRIRTRFQLSMPNWNSASTRARLRCLTWRKVPMLLFQPKTSSMRLRIFRLTA